MCIRDRYRKGGFYAFGLFAADLVAAGGLGRLQALTLPVAATPNAPDRLLSVRGLFLALHSP